MESGTWHRIYAFEIEGGKTSGRRGYEFGPLGDAGWRQIKQEIESDLGRRLPPPVRPTLPALFDAEGVFAVPHLGYNRTEREIGTPFVKRLNFVAFDGIGLTTDCLASPVRLTISNSLKTVTGETGGPKANSRSSGSCRLAGQERIEN